MKTLVTIIFSISFLTIFAQENKYEQAMSNAIEKMNKATMVDDFLASANTFERISMNKQKEWLPMYYAAYSYIVISYSIQDNSKKDSFLDKAQKLIDTAFKLAPKESEMYSLQAFLYPSRITVDPLGRGSEFMAKMNHSLEKAIQLNPENPRSYYLQAITTLNLPESLGGGATIAKPIFKLAKDKFDNFQPETFISPVWGKEHNNEELNKL